jgi:RNA polymerase sigma-70 factor (ECF subfamily)
MKSTTKMKTKIKPVLAILVAAAIVPLAVWAQTQKLSVKLVAPVVVKTVPEAGSTGVDPAITEIQVTFSKPMQDGSWSWVGKEYMPEIVGQPRYLADGRTCVLTVKLEAGRTYAIGINSQSHGNFKDRQGRSAMPYLLAFETKP